MKYAKFNVDDNVFLVDLGIRGTILDRDYKDGGWTYRVLFQNRYLFWQEVKIDVEEAGIEPYYLVPGDRVEFYQVNPGSKKLVGEVIGRVGLLRRRYSIKVEGRTEEYFRSRVLLRKLD